MSTVGIIAEYNPFHKGHEYLIEEAKRITNASNCVIVMSGNFVQRGEPAIYNKHSRCQMAIECGADLVIELPVVFATSGASFFAKAAVGLLDSLGVVDYICFGSESGQIDSLVQIARVLVNESDEYKKAFKQVLSLGRTTAAARQAALDAIGMDGSLVASPNNILAIEYIKALLELNSSIIPVRIKRLGKDYDDSSVDEGIFSSAMGIRALIQQGNDFINHIPAACVENIMKETPVFFDEIKEYINMLLGQKISAGEALENFYDVKVETANKFENHYWQAADVDELIEATATREVTRGNIKRSLMHILLDIKKEEADRWIENGMIFYIRVLGFTDKGARLLGKIKKKSKIPIISNPVEGKQILDKFYGENVETLACAKEQLERDLYAASIYRMFEKSVKNGYAKHEFEYKIIKG